MADDYEINPGAARSLERTAGRSPFYRLGTDDSGRPVMMPDDDTDDAKGESVAGMFLPADEVGFSLGDLNPVKMAHDVVHTLNSAAKTAGKVIGSIPIVGKPLLATIKLNPQVVVGGFVGKMLSGARIDRALLATGKEQIGAIKEIAPYVASVVSFVPGIGTGVAGAIAAGVALAEGRTITDAVIAGARGALPGGPLAAAAFDTTLALAQGKNITDAALTAALNVIPDGPARKAAQIAIALASAQKIQSHAANVLATSDNAASLIMGLGATALKQAPAMAKLIPREPTRAKGYQLATGIMATTGVNAHQIASLRARLKPEEKAGFDTALKTAVMLNNPQWTALVRNGIVTRGNWKAGNKASPSATLGRLVSAGKVQSGIYTRG